MFHNSKGSAAPSSRKVLAVLLMLCLCAPLMGQKIARSDRDLLHRMLRDVAGDVQKKYYDTNFHGVDWNATVKAAD